MQSRKQSRNFFDLPGSPFYTYRPSADNVSIFSEEIFYQMDGGLNPKGIGEALKILSILDEEEETAFRRDFLPAIPKSTAIVKVTPSSPFGQGGQEARIRPFLSEVLQKKGAFSRKKEKEEFSSVSSGEELFPERGIRVASTVGKEKSMDGRTMMGQAIRLLIFAMALTLMGKAYFAEESATMNRPKRRLVLEMTKEALPSPMTSHDATTSMMREYQLRFHHLPEDEELDEEEEMERDSEVLGHRAIRSEIDEEAYSPDETRTSQYQKKEKDGGHEKKRKIKEDKGEDEEDSTLMRLVKKTSEVLGYSAGLTDTAAWRKKKIEKKPIQKEEAEVRPPPSTEYEYNKGANFHAGARVGFSRFDFERTMKCFESEIDAMPSDSMYGKTQTLQCWMGGTWDRIAVTASVMTSLNDALVDGDYEDARYEPLNGLWDNAALTYHNKASFLMTDFRVQKQITPKWNAFVGYAGNYMFARFKSKKIQYQTPWVDGRVYEDSHGLLLGLNFHHRIKDTGFSTFFSASGCPATYDSAHVKGKIFYDVPAQGGVSPWRHEEPFRYKPQGMGYILSGELGIRYAFVRTPISIGASLRGDATGSYNGGRGWHQWGPLFDLTATF